MSEQLTAFETLSQLAQSSRSVAKGLPAQIDARPQWSGIGFSLLGSHFVAPMGEVAEMLEVPGYTHLPGVQPWVRGVANVRGRLLPLFDFAAFFGGRLVGARKRRRILVLETDSFYSGLIVDQVFGMQHFPVDEYQAEHGQVVEAVQPFVQGGYEAVGEFWNIFRLSRLTEDPRFIKATKN